jgi:hypothetical protein
MLQRCLKILQKGITCFQELQLSFIRFYMSVLLREWCLLFGPCRGNVTVVFQLKFAISEMQVIETVNISGTHMKLNVRRWKPLPRNAYYRPRTRYLFCSYSYLRIVWAIETVAFCKRIGNAITNLCPVYGQSVTQQYEEIRKCSRTILPSFRILILSAAWFLFMKQLKVKFIRAWCS